MAKILRCPACGALWQLDAPEDAASLRCGACGAAFSADKAETIAVDDDALHKLIAQKAEKAEREAAAGAAKMAELADSLTDFDAPGDTAADEAAPRTSGLRRFLLGIITLAALALIAATLALLGHQFVLERFPLLRPMYETVCTQVPCPGFVWAQPSAFTAQAQLDLPTDGTGDAKKPDVRMVLRNVSSYPQQLPIVEMKLLDPAGDTIAQRILEPADYGVSASPAVIGPHETFETLVHVQTALPYDAAGVVAAPVKVP